MENLLKTCLGIKKTDTVLIVTDDNKLEVAWKLEKAAVKLSDEVILMKMRPRAHHAQEPPGAVSEAMKNVDVVMMPTTMSLTHTDARRHAANRGARIASMPGITMEMLENGGMTADYHEVKRISNRVAEMLTEAKTITIKTGLGCDFKSDLGKRKGIADSGILTKKGDAGNLPGGEGFIAPVEGKSSGVLVFDGSFGGIGVLENPLRVSIENGRVKKVENDGGRFKEIIRKHENADVVAEIGIGTNPNAKIIGNVLEDEKVLGTAHVAFGDSHTFGGKTRAEVHLDGMIKRPTIFLDDRLIMEKGRLID